ncbi:hypothetical protein LSH36_632g01076 [Paralvinella palmiformis]|uniref:Protein sleepless n=1 Tax=Paralvinella palmiformis TaxID=53620 RepID=A0AAD9MUB4_9ANNE|nr:hypothetical protein LSH36_632g01076 [Paralvinella palmiformis]
MDILTIVTCLIGFLCCIYYAEGQEDFFYQLRMRRTCSEMLNINIQLTDVCKTERYGNGILCMCPSDFCNRTGPIRAGITSYLVSFVTVQFVLFNA